MHLGIAAWFLASFVWRLPHIHIAISRCQGQLSRCITDSLHIANVREPCLYYYTALQVETHHPNCAARYTAELLVLVKANLHRRPCRALSLHYNDDTILRLLQPHSRLCDYTLHVQSSPCHVGFDPLHVHFIWNTMLHILLIARNRAHDMLGAAARWLTVTSKNGMVCARCRVDMFVDGRQSYKDY